jgi:hypothetical protein
MHTNEKTASSICTFNKRIYNENRQQFTWRRKDKTQASRIDMILLGKDLLSHVQVCKIKSLSNLCLSSLVNFDLFLQYIVVTSRISTFP